MRIVFRLFRLNRTSDSVDLPSGHGNEPEADLVEEQFMDALAASIAARAGSDSRLALLCRRA